ncbi:MAG: hypothetical protein OXE44_02640 [Nitrospinae bacterium]|nr:hypothetical protein [Nitrospinota bacterium]
MNIKAERQPTTSTDILNKYANCMEEIKKRTEVVHGFLRHELHATYLQTTVESICLQIRKILELIALASLVANKSEYEKHRKNFQGDWNAKRILKTLDKANPKFYPIPSEQVISPETGKVVEAIPITSGYLSRADYEDLYDECSEILHASNPFSSVQQEVQSFLDNTPEWMQKIRVLLNHHQVQLIDKRVQLWVLMKAKSDGKVHVYEFMRID